MDRKYFEKSTDVAINSHWTSGLDDTTDPLYVYLQIIVETRAGQRKNR